MKNIVFISLIAFIIGMLVLGYYIQRDKRKVEVTAVGDILLARGVKDRINQKGIEYPYEKVEEILHKKDIVLGNLEGPIYEGDYGVYKAPYLVFKGVKENVPALKQAGFNILNLANNHSMDYGSHGLSNTMDMLERYDIKYMGAGENYLDARKPLIINKKGMKIGFLGYSIFPPEGYIYLANKADIARVDFDKLEVEIKSAKEKCDFLIASFHWGNEYENYPSENQKMLAHMAVDSGADIIIGHHPHVLQGIEKYKNKYIFYSLGNFIFDRQIHQETDKSIILNISIEKNKIKEISLFPIIIKDCQPSIAKGEEAEYIFSRLRSYSDGMSTQIVYKKNISVVK
ncbi:CapA family protein [Sporosalibacterium faouarense]|uniref:CapA family protein n=1 Tax=Sporosalibacterium faouarense TaxID=516123 RepID=UPI00192C3AD1